MRTSFLFFIFLQISLLSWGQSQRDVTVEWEKLPGAKVYELELTRIPVSEKTKPEIFQSTEAAWTGPLLPGTYLMRIRAKDHRKAPGKWSPPEQFQVGLEPVVLLTPLKNELKKTTHDLEETVTFKWQPVEGASQYQFELSSRKQDFTLGLVLEEPQVSLTLPVAEQYKWKVQARGPMDNSSESPSSSEFTLLGKKLLSPKVIEVPTLGGIMWEKPEHAETFDYLLMRLDASTGKWERQDAVKESKAEGIEFKPEWVGGTYALAIQAKAPLRESSDRTESRFKIKDSNRKPAAINSLVAEPESQLIQNGYLFIEQLLSQMDYESTNTDASGRGQFTGLGGSFRIGAGYFWNDTWAFGGSSEAGGLLEDTSRYAFSSQELHFIRRKTTSDGEARHYFGLYSKEVPMVSATGSNPYDIEPVRAGGFHYGYERNHQINSKYGFQWNIHPFLNVLKIHTPNSADLTPTISLKAGLLGSYQFSPLVKGLAGYTYRLENIAYRPIGNNDRDNSIEMEGHFLNLLLEWDL